MVWKALLSPWAFWMSDCTPAALNASVRYLRSAVSQRADDLLSGRITPILGVLPVPEPDPEPELDEELFPQAARPPAATTMAARAVMPLRMSTGPFARAAAGAALSG